MKKIKQSLSFGSIAKQYQRYRRSYDPKLYELLFSLIPAKEVRIMDLGCGTGKSAEPLVTQSLDRKISVIGVDPDEAMLHEAKLSAKKNGLPIEYILGSAEKLPFPKASFDAVIAGTSFNWFANKNVLSTIRSVLKEKGLFFVFWARYAKSQDTPREVATTIGGNIYKKYEWKGTPKVFANQEAVGRLLLEAGFKDIHKAIIPFVEKKTLEQTIGCLKTNSSYIIMPSRIKTKFIKEMAQAYKVALNGKKYDTNNLELRIFYGFK